MYGYDQVFNYCWYTTYNVPTHTVLVRIIMTWGIWISISLIYLIFAVTLITCSLFSKTGPLSRIGRPWNLTRHPSEVRSKSKGVDTALTTTLAKRDIARRALTVRVLGYISVPVICVFPGVIIDFIARGRPDVYIPPMVPLIAAVTAGLMGTFNAILLSFDPSVVAVVLWPHWMKKKERERLELDRKAAGIQQLEPTASSCKPAFLDDIDMAQTKVVGNETQEVVVTTVHLQTAGEHGLELQGHSVIPDGLDPENSGTSTFGYNMNDLAKIYHGL